MSDTTSGFLIGDETFPIPVRYGFRDAEIVEEICHMEFADFARRLDAMNEGEGDAKALRGLVACAVWQKHRAWPLDRAARFIRDIDFESLKLYGGKEADDTPGETVPAPAPAEEA